MMCIDPIIYEFVITISWLIGILMGTLIGYTLHKYKTRRNKL